MAKAGVISIDVDAGTAKFLIDLDKANAKLKDFGAGASTHGESVRRFGKSAESAGHSTVSSMQAASAAIRLLENPLGNNIRAVERFISTVPGAGVALQKAFGVIGPVVASGLLFKLGDEAVQFFQKIYQAPDRIATAFRELNAPLAITNDELRVANDRIENEIAKLEKKPENGLKLALDEAALSAEQLADSLDKDLGKLQELLAKDKSGARTLLGAALGEYSTEDLDKEIAAFRKKLAGISSTQVLPRGETLGGVNLFADGAGKKLAEDSRSQTDSARMAAYVGELARLNHMLGQARSMPAFDETGVLKLQGAITNLQREYERLGISSQNAADKGRLATAQQKSEQDRLAKEALEKRLEDFKQDQNAALAHLESTETLLASERADFREAELAELIRNFGEKNEIVNKFAADLRTEIGRDRQESLKEADSARDKDLKSEQSYQEKLTTFAVDMERERNESVRRGAKQAEELTSKSPNYFTGTNLIIPDLPAGGPNIRPSGIGAFNAAGALASAGFPTAQQRESQIHQDEELFHLAQQMNVPLSEQVALRERILEEQIALAQSEGKSSNQQQIQLANLRIAQTLQQWKTQGIGSIGGSLAQAGASAIQQLPSTVDGIAGAFARAATGAEHFGQAFRSIGQQLAQQAIGSVLKIGIDAALKSLVSLIPAFRSLAAAQSAAAAAAKGVTSAVNTADAESNAAVAATGAAAAVAWIPVVGPALAAAAAAATLASLQPYVALAAFAGGTDFAPGGSALVGERGPEIVNLPRGSQVIPNHRLADVFGSSRSYVPAAPSSTANNYGGHTFKIYEAGDARRTVRKISNLMRTVSYSQSPAGSN